MHRRILFVRHGETAWNRESRFQGHSDVELSPRGLEQARSVRDRLAGERLAAVYTSDLRRASETARIVAEAHGMTAVRVPELKEIAFGEWEGLTFEEIKERDGARLDHWVADPISRRPPGGESGADFAARVVAAFERVIAPHDGDTVVLACHGGTIQLVLCHLLGLPSGSYWQLHVDPGSLSELNQYDQGPILNSLNDTCHLRHAGAEGAQGEA